MQPGRNHPEPADQIANRKFRLVGAIAAFLAVLGIAALGFWLIIRIPRF